MMLTCFRDELGLSEECIKNDCPIDCMWGNWSAYSSCSVTCGTGSKSRRRGFRQAQNKREKAQSCAGGGVRRRPLCRQHHSAAQLM